ncbi:unnamed protein product, partial [Closterium sp. Naga37s-1]
CCVRGLDATKLVTLMGSASYARQCHLRPRQSTQIVRVFASRLRSAMSTFTPVSEVEPSRVDVPRIAPWVFLSLKETECLDSGWAIERVTFTSLVDADSSVNDTSLT